MKIRPTAALLVLASVAAFTAPARADAPESHVLEVDKTAPGEPRVELLNIEPPADRHAGGSRTRRLPEHRVVGRERLRSTGRTDRAEHRRNRRALSQVAVHDDGGKAQASDSKALPSSFQASSGSSVVAEARRWIGTNPTDRKSLWCARFMNFVLKRVGLSGTSSDMANSFASYGQRLAGPKVGAIAVMSRGRGGGHVGVVSGFDSHGDPIVISGNHSHRVAEAVYSRSRIYAYVAPEK